MKKTNILLLFPDQHRGDWTQFNTELPLRTPNLVKLAKNGVRFTNAITPSPVCSPARSCLASGREYDNCNIIDNGQSHPAEEISFYKLLRDSGYHTMACGKFDLAKPEYSYGISGKHESKTVNGVSYFDKWGFSDGIDNGGKHNGVRAYFKKKGRTGPYLHYLEQKGLAKKHVYDFLRQNQYTRKKVTPLSDEDYADNYIGRNGIKLLQSVPKGRPWFLQVNFNGPHEPMDVTQTMRNRWKDVNFPEPNQCTRFNKDQNLRIRQNYAAMIENLDRWIGIYVDELKKRGEFENTIIAYSSDHGEMLGDHNLVGKTVPYHPSSCIPMVISGPNINKNIKFNKPVGLIDLAGTFLDYAGIDIPNYMDCKSLKPVLTESSDNHREYTRSGLRSWRMVFDGRYKLIIGYNNSKGKKGKKISKPQNKKEMLKNPVILFDLEKDPLENDNIAPENPDIVDNMMKILI